MITVGSGSDGVDWIAIAQVIAAILTPLVGVFAALFTVHRNEREKLTAVVSWDWSYDQEQGPEEYALLHVHNISNQSVFVTDVDFLDGAFRPKKAQGTALEYDDPDDLNFPYEIEAGKARRFLIDSDKAQSIFGTPTKMDRFGGFFGRSPIWIQIRTMANRRIKVAASAAIPWEKQPEWLQK